MKLLIIFLSAVMATTSVSEPVLFESFQAEMEQGQNDPALYISEEDVEILAKLVYGEAGGIASQTEQAAVAWCVLNRVDNDIFPDTIEEVVTQESQFYGYIPSYPVTNEIYSLCKDVLYRWCLEKLGKEDSGRVLPKEYLYFYGDGAHNHFTKDWGSNETWDWSLTSPYEKENDIYEPVKRKNP